MQFRRQHKYRILIKYGFLLMCMIMYIFPVNAKANSSPKLEINGQKIASSMGIQIVNGRSMVPLKTITKTLGIEVRWFSSSRIIRIDDIEGTIFMEIGETKAHIDGRSVQLDVPPMLEGGQTLVPLRFMAEALQAQIEWLPEQKLIRMNRGMLVDENPAYGQESLLLNKIIVLDPGHGGRNPGAIGVTGTWESEINYDITIKLQELLKGTGAFIVVTREAEEDPGLSERSAISNDNRADLFISIHADSHPNPETRGSTVYAHYNATEENWALAWYVHDEILKLTGLESKGLRAANFVVLRETMTPAILIESAYLTNRYDEELLKDSNFRGTIAQGIYNGIIRYYSNIAE